jgi:uncharacterized protein
MWGKEIAVDVKSGNFFEVDKLASNVIGLLDGGYNGPDIVEKLSGRYSRKAVLKSVDNLNGLKKKGMLFSSDEKKETKLKRKITDLTLNIVSGCNLSCRYCWNQRGGYGNNASDKGLMDARVAFKAVDLLIKESKGANDLVVDFYGGEPLLNYNLIKDVVGYCARLQKNKPINFRFLLATNGTLLSREKAEFLIENGVDIAVSLDGNKKIQDTQRPFLAGGGSFDAVMNNLDALNSGYRKRIVGRATFTPYSKNIIKTFKFLRNLGFERIEVCESEKAGYGLEPNNRFFFTGTQGIRRLKSLYYNLAIFYTQEIIKGNLSYENTYFNRFFKQLSRLYHIQSIVGTCSAGFSLMAVDRDAGIYPCTAFVGIPRFKIGDAGKGINEQRLSSFLSTKISTNETCNECWAKRICQGCGSCYNLNYFLNKNIGKPDSYYCELFRYKTKLMMAMIAEISEKAPELLEAVLIPEYYARRGRKQNAVNS